MSMSAVQELSIQSSYQPSGSLLQRCQKVKTQSVRQVVICLTIFMPRRLLIGPFCLLGISCLALSSVHYMILFLRSPFLNVFNFSFTDCSSLVSHFRLLCYCSVIYLTIFACPSSSWLLSFISSFLGYRTGR